MIECWGIETNNLKNIDIKIETNSLNLIIGYSGSGKSSLAYDTIASIGKTEFMSMFYDGIEEPTYRVKGYKNMLPAVPIKQLNFNNNLHSTIGTYFGLNRSICFLYSSLLKITETNFTLNKTSNVCQSCHGLGFKKAIDEYKIINYDISLKDNPIKCWNRHKDFYSQIIIKFCNDNNINPKKTFRQLNNEEKNLFLYGQSNDKYKIRYKKNVSFSSKTSRYYGVLSGISMIQNFSIPSQFYSDIPCEECQGQKYSPEINSNKILGISIGDFMTTKFDKLLSVIEAFTKTFNNENLDFTLKYIHSFIKKACELNLGHLFFHRAIPTLSGGELQRIRMVQIFNTQLTNLLIVLDEPLAGLSGTEKDTIYKNILELTKKHTIIVVDHSNKFIKTAKTILALGNSGQKYGGYIISEKDFIKEQNIKYTIPVTIPKQKIKISINHNILDYNGVDISIGKNCLNLITGKSGIGKSILLKEYLSLFFEDYVYINQKPLLGAKTSCVATILDISTSISTLFAKKYDKEKNFFSNTKGSLGSCKSCGGYGHLEYGDTKIECTECGGTGFDKILKKYTLDNKNIFEIFKMDLEEAYNFFSPIDKKISKILIDAIELKLAHLLIGQSASSLSGGENIRLKLLKTIKSTAIYFGIDEPFKGLSKTEIFSVISFIEKIRKKTKTIIIVDHTEDIEHFFGYKITLTNKNQILTEL